MMGITDWLFRRTSTKPPLSPPSSIRERQRQNRERAKDERVRAQLRQEIRALDDRLERIGRIARDEND